MGHARALLTAPDPEAAARIVVSKGLSVRQTEALAKAGTDSPKAKSSSQSARSVDADLAALERQLGDMLGLNVRVKHSLFLARPARHDLSAAQRRSDLAATLR